MVSKEDIIEKEIDEFQEWVVKQKLTEEQRSQEWQKFHVYCDNEAKRLNQEQDQNYYSEEEKQEIKDQAEQQEKLSLKNQWMYLFNQKSYYNEIIGEIFFYIYVTLFIKHKKHYVGDKFITLLLHTIIFQNTGSGKDKAADFMVKLVKETNMYLELHPIPGLEPIKIYELSGTETVESLINYFADSNKKTHPYDFKKVIPGILESNDLILSRESSFLFLEKRGDKQTKSEIFLTAMEGRKIEKSLKGWQGRKTTTVMNACFIGLSRPFRNMEQSLLNTGFQQRGFNLCREIDSELRKNMTAKAGVNAYKTMEEVILYNKEIKQFVARFCELIKRTNFTKIRHKNIAENNKYLTSRLFDFNKDIVDTVMRRTHRDILEGFVSRFKDLAVIISYLEAFLREKYEIDLIDCETAFQLIQSTYEYLKCWIENIIIEEKQEVNRRIRFLLAVRGIFNINNNQPIKKADFTKLISEKLKVSLTTAYSRVNEYLQGQKSLLVVDDDKNISLRK